MKKTVLALSIILLLSGCAAGGTKPDGQGDKGQADTGSTGMSVESTLKAETEIQDKPVINNEYQKLKTLEKTFMDSDFYKKEHMIPLTVSPDLKYFIAYNIKKVSMADENELILIGMPRQPVDLQLVDLKGKKAKNLGQTEFIISYAWSGDGRLLSLVTDNSVKILDVAAESLSDVPLKYVSDGIYNSNWGNDNRTLYIHLDTIANYYAYDSVSRKMEKVRGGFKEGDTVYRGCAGKNILISKGERVGVAKGLYVGGGPERLLYEGEVVINDINESRILVSCNDVSSGSGSRFLLDDYDTDTGNRRTLYDGGDNVNTWKIYKASYLKTTGDVIYTTFETYENGVRYLLIRIRPDGKETSTEVPSPLYTVSPGESILHFAVFRDGESCIMDTGDFNFIDGGSAREYKNSDIRQLMFHALDIYSSHTPDIEKIRRNFINTYDPVPQEALDNILLEAEKTQYWKFIRLETGKNITMIKLKDNGSRASIVLKGFYFRGPHELVKKEGRWYITGFSTWPDSKVRNDVYKACTRFINKEMKTAATRDKIPEQYAKIEVGEIELWAMSDPHRAIPGDDYAKNARVKIIFTLNDGSIQKYQAHFSRLDSEGTWKCDDLGKLSASLFPEQ